MRCLFTNRSTNEAFTLAPVPGLSASTTWSLFLDTPDKSVPAAEETGSPSGAAGNTAAVGTVDSSDLTVDPSDVS